MANTLDVHPRERVSFGVVSEVVSKGSFGFKRSWVDDTADCEVGIGVDRSRGLDHGDASTGHGTGKGQFTDSFRKWHHGSEAHGRGATDSDGNGERDTCRKGLLMMHSDATVQLVVQSDFAIGLVLVSGELDAVHAEVASRKIVSARFCFVCLTTGLGWQTEDLRKGNKWSAIIGPGNQFGQVANAARVRKNGSSSYRVGTQGLRKHCPSGPGSG